MAKRLLDCTASDFERMTKGELLFAMGASEGRVLACETIGKFTPLVGGVSNAELAAAMGGDVILLNIFDMWTPQVQGLPDCAPEDTIRMIKKLTGRPVGINLEPVEQGHESEVDTTLWGLTEGRKATRENALRAADMGVDFVLLTGNPGIGVTNKAITDTLAVFREAVGDRIILCAGKMHASGSLTEAGENIVTKADVKAFADAGADIILLPAPGTVPGVTMEQIRDLVGYAHSLGKLTITAIGTSQEGADVDTIKRIALMCKMTGTDIHHIGDSGFTGIASPEAINAYSVAIRGVRHTYRRLAMSIKR